MSADAFKPFVDELARASGDLINGYFAQPDLEVDYKADDSPVTRADRDAETLMRDMIAERYPEHGIVGEEYGNTRADAEYVWVLDPVDGTISFAHGAPLFGTLIGLLHKGQPILGAIHQPTIGQLCVGDNSTTTLNGEPVRVRETVRIEDALMLSTDLQNVARYQDRAGFEVLHDRVKLFRGWGDCFGYLQVACGRADIMLDPILNPWDLLPIIPVVRGAGGMVSTWDGGDPVSGASCVAATPALHAETIAILGGKG